jgi:hypothetical protein
VSFIDTQDLSDYIGRDVTDDDGAVICVDSAIEMVRTLTEQDFSPLTDTIALDGTGTDTLLLPQLPVSGAGTVVVNGGTLTTSDYVATADGHLIRTGGTAIWTTWLRGDYPTPYWPPGRRNVTVTYDHGYAGTVPADVRAVALNIASRMITQGGASFESVGQVSKRYAVASTDLTNGEKAILRRHRVAR